MDSMRNATPRRLEGLLGSRGPVDHGLFALCAQCAGTLMTIKRETNSWIWPTFTFVYMTLLAYLGALLTYQIGMHLQNYSGMSVAVTWAKPAEKRPSTRHEVLPAPGRPPHGFST